MRTRSLAAILAGLALASCQPTNDAATEPTLETDQDKLFYTLGLALSEGLASYALTPEEVERVILGVRDGVTGQPERIDDRMKYARMVRQLREERTREVAGREREQAVGYLVAQAAQPGAETRGPRKSWSTTTVRFATAPSSTARSGAAIPPGSA